MRKIALLPGGFKPPHAGHYNMAKYLAKETNADVIVVKVGAKEREGVTREMSMQLWNIYKDSDPDPISDKLLIQSSTSNSPVRDVYDFVEDTAPEGSMVFLGMGEKDINDSRFKNISKFAKPRNIEFKTVLVPPQAGGVSGTEMRGYIKNNQETFFFNALPDHMSEKDKQDAWNIVTKNINENYPPYKADQVQKVRYQSSDTFTNSPKDAKKKGYLENDPKKGTGKKPKGSGRRLYTDENPKDTVKVKFSTRQDIVDTLSKASFKNKSHARKSQIINLIHQRVRAAIGRAKDPSVKKRLRSAFEYIKKRKEASKRKTQNMKKESTFSKNWWKDIINEVLLFEGGAAGHMAHPFDLPNVTSGRSLLNVFNQAANSLQNNPGAVKIDGVNSSIRLVDLDGKKQFVMDRGSKKPLDIKGITKDDLLARFGDGHGMIKVGGNVLDMFNEALPAIQGDLEKLGALNDPNILFNMEYVSGKTNVQDYGSNFIAIHGLNRIEIKDVQGARGPLQKRISSEVNYDKGALQSLLDNLAPIAKKRGFEVYGSVPTTMSKKPNFNSALSKRYTVEFSEQPETKTLGQWLNSVDNIPVGDFIFMNIGYQKDSSTINRKKVGAVSKQVYLAILNGENVDGLFENKEDRKKAIDGFVTYLATEKLGDEVLKVLDSPMGSVENHEGVVIRDEKIASVPFKITGKFILGGMASDF